MKEKIIKFLRRRIFCKHQFKIDVTKDNQLGIHKKCEKCGIEKITL